MNGTPLLFDRALYLARQRSASSDALAQLDQRLSDELIDRLSMINRHFGKALLIAPRPHAIAMALQQSDRIEQVETSAPSNAEHLQLMAENYDAVISLIDLHTVNDVPGYLAQCATALKPDGLAMAGFFAGETLRELRESWLAAEQFILQGASPRVAPMIDLRETGRLLQRAGLALPVADIDRVTLRYADAFALMREIKTTGHANCLADRSTRFTSRRLLTAVASHYASHFANADGRITATLDIAWAMAWKPHASQQQPLKPGSAKARLADALKVDETKLKS